MGPNTMSFVPPPLTPVRLRGYEQLFWMASDIKEGMVDLFDTQTNAIRTMEAQEVSRRMIWQEQNTRRQVPSLIGDAQTS